MMNGIACRTMLLVAVVLAGCSRDQAPAGSTARGTRAKPRPSVALRVVVVNEPKVAEAINRLRGEWAERSGGELTASQTTWAALAGSQIIEADVVVFPSRYLGELCVRGWLRPVRPNVLRSEDLHADDFFPPVRERLIKWGGSVMALPLGIQPQGGDDDGSLAVALLSLAAPKAMSRNRMGVLFDSETMKPRITEQPFIDALTALSHSAQNRETASESVRALVLGFSDRLAAVTSSTRNAASAFKLLAWLAQAETSSQLASAAGGTMSARRSLAGSESGKAATVASAERAESHESLPAERSGEQCLIIPAIPRVDDYLAALDQAVKEAVFGGVAPRAALQQAARRWEAITDDYGRDVQRRAYLNHLGISEP